MIRLCSIEVDSCLSKIIYVGRIRQKFVKVSDFRVITLFMAKKESDHEGTRALDQEMRTLPR